MPTPDFQLTDANYYSPEADELFYSVSQFNAWLECPAKQAAKIRGLFSPPEPRVFFLGHYVHCKFTEPEKWEAFCSEHHSDIYKTRTLKGGKVKTYGKHSDVVLCDQMIKRVQDDALASELLTGQGEVIVQGEIAGRPWRGKIDILKAADGCFTDLKTARDFWDKWIEVHGQTGRIHRTMVPWYDGYWRQMAVYRELCRQMFGKDLVPVVVGVTKQEPPAIRAWEFANEDRHASELDALDMLIDTVDAWKTGAEPAPKCGDCEYCRGKMDCEVLPAENLAATRALPKWWRDQDPMGNL